MEANTRVTVSGIVATAAVLTAAVAAVYSPTSPTLLAIGAGLVTALACSFKYEGDDEQ